MSELDKDTFETTKEILSHIGDVGVLISRIAGKLGMRIPSHDRSKFDPVEFGPLLEMTSLIRREGKADYGTPEYKVRTAMLGPMLEHHYAENRHHPEHFANGIHGMTLVDLTEMFCDWCAAAQARNTDATVNFSYSAEKYKIPEMLVDIFRNTADELGIKHK